MTSEARLAALLDTNVLYPAGLRDIILQTAADGFYEPKWSQGILQEWRDIDSRRGQPSSRGNAERIQRHLQDFFFNAEVTGYEYRIDDLWLPDDNDRHVLAAAIEGHCDLIVTQNLRDFPARIVHTYDLEVVSPDEFLTLLADPDPQAFAICIRGVLEKLQNPSYTVQEYLRLRERDGLAKTVALLRQYARLLE